MNGHRRLYLIGAFIFLMAAFMYANILVSNHGRDSLVQAQIAQCERVTADRVDIARALTAHAEYLREIAASPSVSAGARKASRKVLERIAESANQVRTRLLRCDPLIRNGQQIIDQRLLKETRGEI